MLLEKGNSSEVVGDLSINGYNQDDRYLHTYLTFGGKTEQEEQAAMRPSSLTRLSPVDEAGQLNPSGTGITWGNNQVTVSGEHPTVSGHYLDQDAVPQNYSTTFTLDDYALTDNYMDGFAKLVWKGEGLYNNKENDSNPDNWRYLRVKQYEKLG